MHLGPAASKRFSSYTQVGYSTCHWCHVMEHESFESEEIAAILNKHYVSIKVDREERYSQNCLSAHSVSEWSR